MPKLTTIKAHQILDGEMSEIEISGLVAWLNIGSKKEKFLIHTFNGTKEKHLTHFKSGKRFGSLGHIKLKYARSYRVLTDRAAAIELINERIARYGLDRVQAVVNSATAIN